MERLDADVGSAKSALQQTPEIFHRVGVDISIRIFHSMVDDSMFVVLAQSVVGLQFVSEDYRASFNMLANVLLEFGLTAITYNLKPDLPATIPMTVVLSFPPVPVITRSRLSLCMFRALAPIKVSSISTSPASFPPCFAC